MFWAVVLVALLPALVASTGDGNLKLLEEEVGIALRACTSPKNQGGRSKRSENAYRPKRSDNFDDEYPSDQTPRIDGNARMENNQYSHERRNVTERDQILVLNATDYDYNGYGAGNSAEKLVNSVPRPALNTSNIETSAATNRTKRNEPLVDKSYADQCLSQCVFANLHVVDSRGIPREAELWNKVQVSVTSQQSRSALRDQIRACFQELQSEAEDNGCSYSNKLERCLMLRFADRVTATTATDTYQSQGNAQKT